MKIWGRHQNVVRKPKASIKLIAALSCAVACATSCDDRQSNAPGPTDEPTIVATSRREPQSLPPGSVSSIGFAPSFVATGRFTEVSPQGAGIGFQHTWDPPRQFIDRLNSYAIGVGVAIGDVDGDGMPDVFFASQTDGGRLYKNLGEWKFKDVTESAKLKQDRFWGTGTTMVDIDNDGDLDLYQCAFGQPNRLYVNQGDGTFNEQAARFGIAYKGASVVAAFADYDNDGHLDMYLLTNHMPPLKPMRVKVEVGPDGNPRLPRRYEKYRYIMNPPRHVAKPRMVEGAEYDKLFRNLGTGRFQDVTVSAGIGEHNYHGLSATWWDYDHDGDQDLYVANDFYGPDHLYRNEGDGRFVDVAKDVFPYIPWFSMGADAADINNDGLVDLFAADMSSTSHYRSQLTMGDMTMEAWFLDYANPRQYMRNMLFVNSGTNRFLETAHFAGVDSTNWTWSVKFGDLDADGLMDLFVTNGMTRDFQNSDLKVQSLDAQDQRLIASPHDFWRQQKVLAEPNMAFRNSGDLQFEDVSATWRVNKTGVSLGASFADLDLDGDLDIVVNNFGGRPGLYRNDVANAANQIQLRLIGTQSNRSAVGAELHLSAGDTKQMRQITVARGYMSSDEPIVHFGIGKATVAERLEIRWPSGIRQGVRDLVAGKRYTIVEPESSDLASATPVKSQPTLFATSLATVKLRHRENSFDDFSTQPLLPKRLSRLGPDIAVGDVDGDGKAELFLGGATKYPGRLFKLEGGTYVPSSSSVFLKDAEAEDMGVLFLDAEGDGDLDLYVASGGVEHKVDDPAYRDRLYVNDGTGSFTKADEGALPNVADSSCCVVAADFDRDGDLDLFIAGRVVPGQYPLQPKSRLLRNDSAAGEIHFTDATGEVADELLDSGMITTALWSDVNGDDWIDLLLTSEWGPVKLFINSEGRLVERTSEFGLSSRLGWWNGIAGADLDHDGDQDFIVTNFGLNTKYRASDDRPIVILYNKFEDTGAPRIVEAAVGEQGELLPIRGRNSTCNAIPLVAEKAPTFHDYASATLTDLFGSASLQRAVRLEANELRSGVLINNGNAGFDFRPLPYLAQLAPGFGVAIFDANLDGHADAFIGQNFYGPQRETGRMAGGLGQLLLGVGDGSFEPLWPHESGISVPGDATSSVLVDIDDDGLLDLVVATNGGAVRAFLASGPKAVPPQSAVSRNAGSPGATSMSQE